jgi:arylformamidase
VSINSGWIDISAPLHNGMVTWPGDAPFERIDTLQIANGDPCNLSQIRSSAHIGTHMDAPRHYLRDAAGIESMPIAAGIGRARVIEIRDPEIIRTSELEAHHLGPGERVLFKTRNSEYVWKTDGFQEQYVCISPEAARYLAESGVQTVIIEGLMLGHVEPGDYEWVCLPLKIMGGDGAPARAVLRRLVL